MVNSMYKMLIVDDEKIERDCIRYLIDASSLDLDVREASDAEQALQILKDWPADILFTDVQMPSGTGLELAREARCILPNIKTIIFSGHAEFEYAKEAVALGAENYILKPVVPRELERTLNKVIRELDEAYDTEQRKSQQRTYLLQYALQQCISGNFSPEKFSEDISGDIRNFRQLVLLDFPASFLAGNYANLYEDLRSSMNLDMETLSLSPTQALLFLRNSVSGAYAFAQKLHRYILENFQTDCCISVSRPVSRYLSLQDAYTDTEQQMEQRFWNSNNRAFAYDHPVSAPESAKLPNDDELLSLIRRNLSSRDAASLRKNLGLLFEKYAMPSNQSQIYVKFFFSNLVTALYPYLPPDASESGKENSLEQVITEIYLQQDISRILQTVRELAEKVIHRYEASESSVRKEILDVKEYINRNYSANLSVELLASIVYLTPDYLSRLFKKSTGRSISQYIRQVRMERASELLLTTNRKVIDIGAEVGYPNYSYFCQSFREYYGKSPEKYRQEEHHETHT